MTASSLASRLICLELVFTLRGAGQSHGYVFFGPGGVTSMGHTSGVMYMGGGAEAISHIGAGGGAELGYDAPWESIRGGIGIASVNGSFHFKPSGRIVPFVTGGYTLFFRSGYEHGFNLGGGVNWWFAEKMGVKAEVRDHVGVGNFHKAHLWTIRAGLTFR